MPVEPVTVSELAEHLRLDGSSPFDDQALLTRLIVAARMNIEDFVNAKIVAESIDRRLDNFPIGNCIRLPEIPRDQTVSAVVVTYEDENGAEQTLSDTKYDIREDILTLKLNEVWPTTSRRALNVKLTYSPGYSAGSEPSPLVQAILMQAAAMYENREAVTQGQPFQTNDVAQALARPYRQRLGV